MTTNLRKYVENIIGIHGSLKQVDAMRLKPEVAEVISMKVVMLVSRRVRVVSDWVLPGDKQLARKLFLW